MTPGDCPTRRTIEGIPVTSVERTLLDLAGLVPARTAGLCLDDALRRRLTTLGRLQKALSENGGVGRKGSVSPSPLMA
jgi:hypothetical protein